MHISEFRVGQRVTHAMWPGCVLYVIALPSGQYNAIHARILNPGRLRMNRYPNDLHESLREGRDTDYFASLADMSEIRAWWPDSVSLPDGL